MMFGKMNPTRAVTLGIGAFAVIGVVAVGLKGGDLSEGTSDSPAVTATAHVSEGQSEGPDRHAPDAQDKSTSQDYAAWVNGSDSDEPAADEEDPAPEEGGLLSDDSGSGNGGGDNAAVRPPKDEHA